LFVALLVDIAFLLHFITGLRASKKENFQDEFEQDLFIKSDWIRIISAIGLGLLLLYFILKEIF
jgi:hypothetical protein